MSARPAADIPLMKSPRLQRAMLFLAVMGPGIIASIIGVISISVSSNG